MVVGVRGDEEGVETTVLLRFQFTRAPGYIQIIRFMHDHSKPLIHYTEPGGEYSCWLDDCNYFTVTSAHQEFTNFLAFFFFRAAVLSQRFAI